jgi:hypothetical protein
MADLRQVSGDERLDTAFTLYPYAFDATPGLDAVAGLRAILPFHEGNHTLIIEEGGRTLATAAASCPWPASLGSQRIPRRAGRATAAG